MSEKESGNSHTQAPHTVTVHHLPAPELTPEVTQATTSTWHAAPALIGLLLGVALEGGDGLIARLRKWEAAVPSSTSAPAVMGTRGDFWRYAILGMMIETPLRVRDALLPIWDTADEVARRVLADAEPALEHWPLDRLKWRIEQLAFDWTVAVVRWSAVGHREEQQGRQLARHAAGSLFDELLDYMARNPEVRELFEQQSASMATTAVGAFRERTVSADTSAERLLHSLLRRPGDRRPAEMTTGSSSSRPPDQSG